MFDVDETAEYIVVASDHELERKLQCGEGILDHAEGFADHGQTAATDDDIEHTLLVRLLQHMADHTKAVQIIEPPATQERHKIQ